MLVVRESIGGSQVLIISVSILLIMIVVLSASIGYTKAFKARNAMLNIIQKHGGYDKSAITVMEEAGEEIYDTLNKMGYMISAGSKKSCPNKESSSYKLVEGEQVYQDQNYKFCIYHLEDNDGNRHYGVQTYMYFELPIFGRNDRFSFPIYGDTYTFFKYGL